MNNNWAEVRNQLDQALAAERAQTQARRQQQRDRLTQIVRRWYQRITRSTSA